MFKKYLYLFLIIIFPATLIFIKNDKIATTNKNPLITWSTAKISKVEIDYQQKKTLLEKKGNNWILASLGGFPAKKEEVNKLLESVSKINGLKLISNNPLKYDIYEVSDKKGAKISVYEGKKKIQTIFFGKIDPSFTGSYFRIAGVDKVFLGQENYKALLTDFDFRELMVLKLNINKLKKLSFKTVDGEISLEKETTKNNDIWLINNKEVSQTNVAKILNNLLIITAKDGYIDQSKSIDFNNPELTITISEEKQPIRVIRINGLIDQDKETDYPLNIENTPIIYLISSTTFNDLLKVLVDFQTL